MPALHTRRLICGVISVAVSLLVTACSGRSESTQATVDDVATPPITVDRAPGECAAPEDLAVIQIRTGGKTYLPSLGVGSSDCSGVTGQGYLVFGYEPILIEASDKFELIVTGAATASVDWTAPDPLESVGNGRWKSTTLTDSCNRLTVQLSSPAGDATATFGADIRVGGTDIACQIRSAAPAINPNDTEPSQTAPDISLVLPSYVAPPPISG